ncbi:RagB/SusD family nutrient uptake outer membrane protein [Chitinophaga nivalis]|uniref:RagB/SusD family nutrient uptake outer membrane protein n=1 Tax=Chitinophaga nivalis TaxID=2991709 RepID=A0ABT3IW80_9BACT|nr:RagB/SusD family nutrient uptake outer membrane protein [Chitinophaga nivalis]MCW3462350.1 RagB/SusD family nutrient uptake outer membrane protein [Chitinophaga nivalis]MCW3487959.1 RagB/SusD family nutrient uptake outer membrane protein [Chitinophaga nivalis]
MKKIQLIRYITAVACLGMMLTSCKKDFLEKKPLTEFREEDVWKDAGLVQAFVNDLYVQMRPGFNEVMLASMSDESRFIHDYNTSRVVQGNVTPDDFGALGDFSRWEGHYKAIRNCNMFLEKVDSVPFTDENQRTRMKGEVHFMRAWYYHMLVKYFGGVPLITKTFKVKGDEAEILQIKRATYEQCVQFIVAECETATRLLPRSYDAIAHKDRVTKGAAMALKSRVLLYAASDQFNLGVRSPLMGYMDAGGQQARFILAMQAAKAIIDSNYYQLYHPTDSAAENYSRVFLDKDNAELIFVKKYDKALLGTSHDIYNGPNGYHNWGGNVPLENFVEGYQMKDGTPFSRANPEQAAHPYNNRDPRFYATVLYDGAKWKQRPKDGIEADPIGVIQTGKYESARPGQDSVWGLDTRNSPIENWNGTFSGYYLRKFMDINLDAQFFRGDQSWIFFRYAEVLLNYAEACIWSGNEGEGIKALNAVRTRAGMPAIQASGAALKALYKYERRYELAFEEHRFFDARRWKQDAYSAFSGDAQGIEVLGSQIKGHPFIYRVISIQSRKCEEQDLLLPIPASEIRKNANLEQQVTYR